MTKRTISLTENLDIQLNDLSKETGLTISDLVRRALELLIKEYRKGEK